MRKTNILSKTDVTNNITIFSVKLKEVKMNINIFTYPNN